MRIGVKQMIKRVTVILPSSLDVALEVYAAGTGRKKNEVFAASLQRFLSLRQEELAQALKQAEDSLRSFMLTKKPGP